MEHTAESVDALIGQVEKLYQSLTGQPLPPEGTSPYAPIPPEKDPEQHLGEQVDRLLAGLTQIAPGQFQTTVGVPPMSLWQTAGDTWIVLDLPGVTRDGVQVRVLSRGLLEVTGERRAPRFDGDARRIYDEAFRGPIRRVIALPPRAAIEQIEARLRDGFLEIRIPRSSGPEPDVRSVPVT